MKNIGQTSQLTGLSQRMLRYFEEQGLLKPKRSEAGIRRFSDSDIAEIVRIRKLHELGFTYPEIKGLLYANDQELAEKGTQLLKKHHEAAHDLQDRIQKLELICFGEPTAQGPHGHRTLDCPHRTAYSLRGADEASRHFQEALNLKEGEFTYWKFSWLTKQEKALGKEFQLFEILEGSSLMAIFHGSANMPFYEASWLKTAGLELNARDLGCFPVSEITQFFSAQEIVLEQKFSTQRKSLAFHALLPYSPLFARLGKRREIDDEAGLECNHDLTFRPLDFQSIADFELLAKWHANPSIRHLALPHRDSQHLAKYSSAEEIRRNYQKGGAFSAVENLMILKSGIPIGNCTLILDPPHKLTKDRKVGWFGITIGEREWRSKGLGKKVMAHLEELTLKHGATMAEVGVFEFNEAAQKLCRALGYEEFGKVENGTYWQGRHWADMRYRKQLRKKV